MQNRRNFIKTAIAGSAIVSMPFGAQAFFGRPTPRLTLLHTNDVHSQIDPFPLNHARFPGMGGFAQRAALINTIRSENEHVLLLDSGDIFQGTPYFNYYEGGLELQLMSKMKYDAATLGNHEFDNGIGSLNRQLVHANFPFINTNYDFTGTLLESKIMPWKTFQKGQIKIGVIGLGVNPDGLIAPSNFDGIKYNDPIAVGDETARMLKEKEKCQLVIALSHLGFKMDDGIPDDLQLATNTQYIDIILGGHTHTFMNEPVIETNTAGKQVIIHQSGQSGVRLGRIDLLFEKEEIKTTNTQYDLK
jgi:5'-nucleotidase